MGATLGCCAQRCAPYSGLCYLLFTVTTFLSVAYVTMLPVGMLLMAFRVAFTCCSLLYSATCGGGRWGDCTLRPQER